MKSNFKRNLLALVIVSSLFTAAHATNGGPSNNSEYNTYNQQTYNQPQGGQGGAGGLGGQGGTGGEGGKGGTGGNASNFNTNGATAIGSNTSTNTNNVTQGQTAVGQGGAGGAGTGVASGLGVAGASATAVGSGNNTQVNFTQPKPSSANAYAPDSSAPRTSCRIFVGLGGTGRDGSLSGGIPIGNDQTCLTGAQIEAMDKANKVQPGTFLVADYLLAICKMEGMGATAGCKQK